MRKQKAATTTNLSACQQPCLVRFCLRTLFTFGAREEKCFIKYRVWHSQLVLYSWEIVVHEVMLEERGAMDEVGLLEYSTATDKNLLVAWFASFVEWKILCLVLSLAAREVFTPTLLNLTRFEVWNRAPGYTSFWDVLRVCKPCTAASFEKLFFSLIHGLSPMNCSMNESLL